MVAYHDDEWGRPLHDEQRLFEMLCLEGAQAGLSWSTILRRRDGYRAAYDGFDASVMAAYDEERQAQLLTDARIIRNRAKVRAFRDNAAAVLRLRESDGGLDAYLWGFVGGSPIVNRFLALADIPAQTPLAEEISRDLRQRGFRFVGPIIVYAFMQSVGIVDDHVVGCCRHPEWTTG
jgi:DNA-3-methyladenine glycosylase I